MHKVSLSLVFLFFLTCKSSPDCQNPLLGPANPFGPLGLNLPSATSSLLYCPKLQSQDVCCDATVINDFQSEVDSLVNSINEFAGKRDSYLITAFREIPSLLQSFDQLKQKVELLNTTHPDIFPGFISRFGIYYESLEEWSKNAKEYKSLFVRMQNERKKCETIILKYYAAVKCLACDANYSSKGLFGTPSSPVINFSPRVYRRIAEECFNYLNYSSEISELQRFVRSESLIKFMSNKVEKVQRSGFPTDMLGGDIPNINILGVNASYESLARFPSGNDCIGPGNCEWACDNFIVGGQLDLNKLQIGGINGTLDNAFNEIERTSRRLQQGSYYDPEEDEAGLIINIELDPANVGGILNLKEKFWIRLFILFVSLILV